MARTATLKGTHVRTVKLDKTSNLHITKDAVSGYYRVTPEFRGAFLNTQAYDIDAEVVAEILANPESFSVAK
jgi:hypothetical protein